MTATFAPTTDRPRLFDDRPPRARRPAAPDRERGRPDSDPFAPRTDPPAPERDQRAPATEATRSSTGPAPHEPPPTARGEQPAGADAPRRGHTLDQLISGVWDDLTAHRTVTCPVCHGHMAPRYGSGALPVGGRCRRCGSSLG
jgi:hypothetical protein